MKVSAQVDIKCNDPILSVSELNQQIRSFLEEQVAPLWISGEISNFACPSSGHWYFTLKDASAAIRCALFQPRMRGIQFTPSNGAQVLVHGKVSLYETRGEYQLIADYIERAGDGLLQKAFNELKAKLAAEGLFEQIHKSPIPVFPKTIGIITSPTGAAIRDILTILKRRFPLLNVIIYPTAVQGAGAAAEIVAALKIANARKECDVLVVGRGGGSLEDLWPFNEEIVARAIFASEIPVISAVGHEIDFTIADFVADMRAATPSHAAELSSPDQFELLDKLNHLMQRLHARHPQQKLQDQMQQLDRLEQRLLRTMQYSIQNKKFQLAELSRCLNSISPLATLDRGYAILKSKSSQQIITSIKTVVSGDKVAVRVSDGEIHCAVEHTEEPL
jgi:exodeoxyribonuclease VII large subunit